VVSDASNSQTTFITDLTETKSDQTIGHAIRFYDGLLATQQRRVAAYNGATKQVTVDYAFTDIPAAGAHFIII
jgi:hypothetical protein